MNGGVCVPEYEWNSYYCDCKPGFYGTHCKRGGKKGFVCGYFFFQMLKNTFVKSLASIFLCLVIFTEAFTIIAS